MKTLKLAEAIGIDCCSPDHDFDALLGDYRAISFEGIRSLSPTFANCLFIAVKKRRETNPQYKLTLTNISDSMLRVIKLSREAVLGSS